MKYIPITWEKLEKDSILLAKQVQKEYGRIDEIVSISRGGMVVSRIVSDILNLKISHITIESYLNFQQTKDPVITNSFTKDLKGKKILLVDELADTGKTFYAALAYLEKLSLASIITAALYVKPYTTYIPHFWVKKIDGWIIFPYNLRETKAAFIEEFGLEVAKKKLQQLGITDWSEIS